MPVSAKKDSSRATPPPPPPSDSERRRIGRIVRDDRDSASVEWVDAPKDYSRVPLSIETTLPPGTSVRPQRGYDPYETIAPAKAKPAPDKKKPVKRDLRKLSEWIKQMREFEARKKRGED